jgi:hypothetical protein
VAQLGARLDGIEEVVGSNPIGSTISRNQSAYLQKSLTVTGFCHSFTCSKGIYQNNCRSMIMFSRRVTLRDF